MKKPLENTYELENGDKPLDEDELRLALTDFRYLTDNFVQVVNKERKVVPLHLNRMQRQFFDVMLPMVDPETRRDNHFTIVWAKPRQGGGTVGLVEFINFLCSYVPGIENMTVLHILPVGDTISRLSKQKVEPIITGVHPKIMPTVERETMSASIMYHYKDILGIKRNNYYELTTSNTSSIRSSTINIAIFDEYAFYRNPEKLEDEVGGAIPDYGFSLSIYISTYDDLLGDHFKRKMLAARDNPDEMALIYTPWFYVYPERFQGLTMDNLGELSDYELNTMIPAFEEFDYPKEHWADAIKWYRTKALTVPNMRKEFPTTFEEILAMGENKKVFSDEAIAYQEENREVGEPHSLVTDNMTKQVKAVPTDISSFKIYRKPVLGHKYIEIIDPITAQNENTDYFAMSIFDRETLEQVATFRDKNMAVEDYADICVSAAKIYNNATICPERNVAEALMVCIRNMGYYYMFYESKQARAKKEVGIRTTIASKSGLLDKLSLLLEQKRIKLHDPIWIEELQYFEKVITTHRDGTQSVKMRAKKSKHDDTVATLWIFAGTLAEHELRGRVSSGWAIM